jgi:putative ABC transport system permease protein
MALGATRGNVLGLVPSQGLRLALTGIAPGLLAAAGITLLLAHMLYGVGPRDPVTMVPVALLIILVALAASFSPARKTMAGEAMTALRRE